MKITQYLIRAIKYLIYFVLIFCLIVGILYLIQMRKDPELTLETMFQEGAFGKIAIFFVVIAAIYPAIGFGKRRLHLDIPFAKSESVVIGAMENLGYEVESQSDSQVCFRIKNIRLRATRMWEDRVVMDICDDDWLEFEGYRKDLQRVLSSVAYAIYKVNNPNEE